MLGCSKLADWVKWSGMPKRKHRKRPDVWSPRTPQRSDSIEIVDAILQAAADLAPNGIDQVSTNQIAKRAGVGVASVYRYFGDKQSIFAAIAQRRNSELVGELRDILDEESDPERGIRRSVRLFLRGGDKDVALRRLLNLDIPYRWCVDQDRAAHEVALGAFAEWLRRILDPIPADLEHRVFLAFGTVRGVVQLRWIDPPESLDDAELVDWLTHAVLVMLRA